MIINHEEILFLKDHAPIGTYKVIAINLGISRIKVINEITTLKRHYDDAIITEFRRLVALHGHTYNEETNPELHEA